MAKGDMHTMPINDLVEHESSEDCICGPTCNPVERNDGTIGYLYVHHSLDGREMLEDDGA